jgi:hypothetical protein
MATQTISAVPSHEPAGVTVVDLLSPNTSPPHEVHFEPEVQTIGASNAEPSGMDFVTQDAEIPNVEPSDVHFGINTVAVFEDQVDQLPQQVILF